MKKEISILIFSSIFAIGVVGGILGFQYYNKQKEENRVSEDNKANDVGQNKIENDKDDKKNSSTSSDKNDKNDGSTGSNKNDKTDGSTGSNKNDKNNGSTSSDKNNGTTNSDKNEDNEFDEPLTIEKMISLANNESLKLKKDYGVETVLQLHNSNRSMDLELKIDNGSLKIIGDSKTWKVTDIEEKVIAIENELEYGCDIGVISSLFLTEKGNLYRLYRDERNSTMYDKLPDGLSDISQVKNRFFEQLDTSKEIKIGLVKLNGSKKVQANSTKKRCQEGATCGGCRAVVYMSNGEYRYVNEGLTEEYVGE